MQSITPQILDTSLSETVFSTGLSNGIFHMTFPGMLLETHPVHHPLSTELLRKFLIRFRSS